MLFGFAVWAYLWRVLPQPADEGIPSQGFWGALQEAIGGAWKPIALIWLVMVLRAVVGQSMLTFMPVLYVSRGYSVVAAGVMISLFTLAGTASGIYCGQLSDRIGYKPIFVLVHALMTPVLLVLLVLPGRWVFAGVALAGGVVLATLPLGVVMAQTLAPKGRSMVASMMMGFAFGLGGIVTPLVGKLADAFSVEQVLRWLALLPLLTLVPIFFFPRVGGDARHGETR
jgi:FSR family fosmidomycin resistance protein-like MFS transporter